MSKCEVHTGIVICGSVEDYLFWALAVIIDILSATRAMNSPFVGRSFAEYISIPKISFIFLILPLFQATSIACLTARSTLLAEVSNFRAI